MLYLYLHTDVVTHILVPWKQTEKLDGNIGVGIVEEEGKIGIEVIFKNDSIFVGLADVYVNAFVVPNQLLGNYRRFFYQFYKSGSFENSPFLNSTWSSDSRICCS